MKKRKRRVKEESIGKNLSKTSCPPDQGDIVLRKKGISLATRLIKKELQ